MMLQCHVMYSSHGLQGKQLAARNISSNEKNHLEEPRVLPAQFIEQITIPDQNLSSRKIHRIVFMEAHATSNYGDPVNMQVHIVQSVGRGCLAMERLPAAQDTFYLFHTRGRYLHSRGH